MKKLVIVISGIILLCFFNRAQAQTISSNLFGQNAWMPHSYGTEVYYGQLNQLWDKVRESKVELIRMGGIAPDLNMPTHAQYIGMIDSIRKIGAEPLVQVPYGRGKYTAADAAAIVKYVNQTMKRNVKYWSIANEPNLPTHGFAAVPVATVASYIKSFSSAMKAIDPAISISGPEYAWFDFNEYTALIGGANDITGKDADGRYYLDIVSFHMYPFGGTQSRADLLQQPVNGFESTVNSLLAMIATANSKNGRTGTAALKWALTEFNVNYANPAQNPVEGVGSHSFLNGQFWAEYFGIAMKHRAFTVVPWSIHESSGNRTTYDLGYLDNSTTFLPRSSYYHEKMMSDNFSGNYIASSDNQSKVKTFACKNGTATVVMIMNQEETAALNYTVQLNTGAISGADLLINVSAGINNSVADRIGPQTTLILTFQASGYLISKEIYSLQHAQNNQAPQKFVQLPYSHNNRIPGIVQAEEYDLGGSALAYADVMTGNSGNVFRTDDVDIEACTDAGGGYAVGWLEANEWIEYTVQAKKAGNYQFMFRTSSLSGGGQLRLYANGADVSGLVNIPSTGSWQKWQTVIVNSISPVNLGTNILHLKIVAGAFNLNHITCALIPKADITSPVTNTVFYAPAAISVKASLVGSSSKIEFYNGNQKLGEDLTAPYTFNWQNVADGNYKIKVRATDSLGAISAFDSVNVVVKKVVTSLNDVRSEEFALYPNPTNGIVEFSTIVEKVEVFDILGTKLFASSHCQKIDLSHLVQGIYMVKINGKNIYKIIKQ